MLGNNSVAVAELSADVDLDGLESALHALGFTARVAKGSGFTAHVSW
jgi:hypothetical protein